MSEKWRYRGNGVKETLILIGSSERFTQGHQRKYLT